MFSGLRFFPYTPSCGVANRKGDFEEMEGFDYAYIHEDSSLVVVQRRSVMGVPTGTFIKQYSLDRQPSAISFGDVFELAKFNCPRKIYGGKVVQQPDKDGIFLVCKNGRLLQGFWKRTT